MKNLQFVLFSGFLTVNFGFDEKDAKNFLRRNPRKSNRRGFEEVWEGNMERECIEENCNQSGLKFLSILNECLSDL